MVCCLFNRQRLFYLANASGVLYSSSSLVLFRLWNGNIHILHTYVHFSYRYHSYQFILGIEVTRNDRVVIVVKVGRLAVFYCANRSRFGNKMKLTKRLIWRDDVCLSH